MIYDIIIAGILVISFLICISAYSLGVKHGRQVRNDSVPRIDINPIKAINNAAETAKAKKEQEEQAEELDKVFSLSREDMLKAVKDERAKGRV
jgi:hypothetical protein